MSAASSSAALIGGLVSVAYGVYDLFRARQIADRNRAHVDSGEESYFEEIRARETYGAPPTSPTQVRWIGVLSLAVGAVLILLSSPIFS